MKIPKVTLNYTEIKELNGEFVRSTTETKSLPCYLTNRALKFGADTGLIDRNIYDEMPFVTKLAELNQPELIAAHLKDVDINFLIKAIYLGCIGANPKLADELSFDDFLDGFDYDAISILTLYVSMVQEITEKGSGEFARSFELVTDHNSGKDKKK